MKATKCSRLLENHLVLKSLIMITISTCALSTASAQTYLDSLNPTSQSNGWGNFERNRSNGEQGPTDGRTLSIAGKTYLRGLGTHAPSRLEYTIPKGCTQFKSDVGVDDEVQGNGSVIARVLLDGQPVYTSALLKGKAAPQQVVVNISGKSKIALEVTESSDGFNYDHADWGNAHFICEAPVVACTAVNTGSYAACYYDNMDFTNLKVSRNETAINFDYGQFSPAASIGVDTFSAVWRGKFNFEAANYDFTATADDGIRVTIDGQAIVDQLKDQSATTYKVVRAMTAGYHTIEVKYFENGGDAVAKFDFKKSAVAIPVANLPLVYAQPLVITKGGTYTGNWESLDSNVAAVTVKTSEPVTIQNCNIRSKGHLIFASWYSVNLTVQNCKGLGLNPNVVNKTHGRFIASEEFNSIVVKNNTIEKTAGIYLNSDKRSSTSKILITQNSSKNIEGRRSNGAGGYTNEHYAVQFAQLNAIKNHPDVEISWNKVVNLPRESFVEDNINIYNSSGTKDRPIRIDNNLIDGAFHENPAATYSGGGIMMGDGNCGDGNVTASNNTVLETSNYGIAVAGGNNQKILNNTVLGLGKLSDGTYLDADSDAGIYLRDYCSSSAHDPSTVYAIGNTIAWGTPSPSNESSRWNFNVNPAAALLQNTSAIILPEGAVNPQLLVNARNAWAVKASSMQIGSK